MIVAETMLNARQHAFVIEFPKDFNGTQAAIRAGYDPESASTQAFRLLANEEVYAAIEERKKDLAAAAGLSVEWVLRQWKEIAEADPAELIWMELRCCRHCYGINHQFQWTEFEYKNAVAAAAAHVCGAKCAEPCVKKIPPLPNGGFGYDPKRAPVADCPQCHGDGEEKVSLADTRRLKGPARRLYAGIKTTQHGIEVKMRDQDAARDKIAQYLGMVITKGEVSGPGGGPIPVANYNAGDLTDDQLAQIIQQEQSKE